MKFPSIKSLVDGIENTVKRFPFEVLFALVGTAAAVTNTEWINKTPVVESWCIRTMLIANLGLLLSLAVTLYTGSKDIKGTAKLVFKFIAALFALGLILLLNPAERSADYFRFFLFSLGFHLLVSFAAFTNKYHVQGFWQFNKTIFLRFLAGVLYSAVLYMGLSAALAAANFLFNLKIEWRTYVVLWYCIAGIFNTLFFLAGIPANTAALNEDTSYPKGLKIFTQYVLIPLATVYVLILLAYEVKLIVQWSLPKGMVSNLILGYAVFGILSILLIYPIREQENNKWIKTYARNFYFLLIPLLVLLFLAMGRRIFAYGITEERYFLLILAFWLLFITAYFLLSKKQNIKVIPVSLCLLTLLSIYGPQSAFSISTYSQRRILINIFKKNNAYKNDKLVSVNGKINKIEGNDAVEKLRYLIFNKELNTLQPYVNADLDAVRDSIDHNKGKWKTYISDSKYELKGREFEWVKKYLGLDKFDTKYSYLGTDSLGVNSRDFYRFRTKGDVISVLNYDYMVDANGLDTGMIEFNGLSFRHKISSYTLLVLKIDNEEVTFRDDELAADLLKRKDLNSYSEENGSNNGKNNYTVPPALLTLKKQTKNYTITLLIDDFEFGQPKKGVIKPMYVAGMYLIKKRG
ncbi:DUF4153 domain-containing protein [Mucilaginibacter sp.]|uniref:DUF4153 domain-containing protein n=1 Tax=Mucilaginibacter sp. TaxID=1882438 RepID=UPI0026259D82|nr:DUF4153 domain-containing protein [Mucilaginibacter sp.]MDB4924837.1 hypothetical protein [Mucilaginibacter sp.]